MKRIGMLFGVVAPGLSALLWLSFASRQILPEISAAAASSPLEIQRAQASRPPRNPERNAYFGDLHVHTSWSSDAFITRTRTTPDEAYRYAMGKPMQHVSGQKIQLRHGGLDFYAVTDHAEYLGMMRLMLDENSPISRMPIAQDILGTDEARAARAYQQLFYAGQRERKIPEFSDPALTRSLWQKMIEAANRNYQPGKFTTFIGFEWTSMPSRANLHRNVIFRGAKGPELPFTSHDSSNPEELWKWIETQRAAGNEALAIPHNSNLSNGVMFGPVDYQGNPLTMDAQYAGLRSRNEPLVEIAQTKGSSDTHPALSPNDEFANFEIHTELLGGQPGTHGKTSGSYVREALMNGLRYQEMSGFNPFKYGIIGSSDTHNSGGTCEEDNFTGKIGFADGSPERRLGLAKRAPGTPEISEWAAAGLAGVWAEENTREAIFDAMKRKETFGTSGTRLKVRFFGSWNFAGNLLSNANWVKTAYSKGVPMGSELPATSGKAKAPQFVVWAVKDPNGANLDRIQIIKGWSRNGQTFEKIYEVALADGRKVGANGKVPPVGNTVDAKTATYQNSIGDAELKAVWTDPDFDASVNAFYYVRVLEIPTPRWSTYDAVRLGVPLLTNVPASIQERGWSSPIWYTPKKTR